MLPDLICAGKLIKLNDDCKELSITCVGGFLPQSGDSPRVGCRLAVKKRAKESVDTEPELKTEVFGNDTSIFASN